MPHEPEPHNIIIDLSYFNDEDLRVGDVLSSEEMTHKLRGSIVALFVPLRLQLGAIPSNVKKVNITIKGYDIDRMFIQDKNPLMEILLQIKMALAKKKISLSHLDLSGNQLMRPGCINWGGAFNEMPAEVESLILRDNLWFAHDEVGREDLKGLISVNLRSLLTFIGLNAGNHIKTLDLSKNGLENLNNILIKEEGTQVFNLADIFSVLPSKIENLLLDHFHTDNIDFAVAVFESVAKRLPKLRKLSIEYFYSSTMKYSAASSYENRLKFIRAIPTSIEYLATNSSFEFEPNNIGAEISSRIDYIIAIRRQCSRLQTLDLSSDRISIFSLPINELKRLLNNLEHITLITHPMRSDEGGVAAFRADITSPEWIDVLAIDNYVKFDFPIAVWKSSVLQFLQSLILYIPAENEFDESQHNLSTALGKFNIPFHELSVTELIYFARVLLIKSTYCKKIWCDKPHETLGFLHPSEIALLTESLITLQMNQIDLRTAFPEYKLEIEACIVAMQIEPKNFTPMADASSAAAASASFTTSPEGSKRPSPDPKRMRPT